MPKRDPVHDYLAGIGRRGGSSTSKAKADAARRNGCKGGRPRKPRCKDCACWNKPNCYPPTIREYRPGVRDPAECCPRFGRVGKPLYRFDYNECSESKAARAKRHSKQKKS